MLPYGASPDNNGCNFSLYCPDADEVFLCFFNDDETPSKQFSLRQRSLSRWYGYVEGVKPGQLYAYRVRPKAGKAVSADMHVGRLLVDPYAKQVSRALNWQELAYAQDDNYQFIPKSIVVEQAPNKPPIEHRAHRQTPSQRVVYEAHVKGLSQLHPDVPEHHRGTYIGAMHPSVIEHVRSLGITCIQFMPLHFFMPEPFITEKGLTNYWGYNPVQFFAPEPRYAVKNALTEVKQMVAAYQQAGIEVIIDVVFNHTAESGEDGPIICFKGLFHKHAYMLVENDQTTNPIYLNHSGCGNTVKASDQYMLNMIIDAMRYWVATIGVDGFRFDLASTLGRDPNDFKSDATFFKIVRQDPVLKNAILIAEPWDIGAGGYQLGKYPDHWLEVNDKFRDTVRAFWRGDTGLKGEFATRLMGSRDIFIKGLRPVHTSVNNITYHDGFCLHDIVSYNKKHNSANLEDNRDGHNHNLSANYGEEGPSDNVDIIELREQQKRNLFASLVLSQGTPHVLAGDEISKTQNGNNNAYCQDNEINWLNWRLDEKKQRFLAYCRYVINLRHRYPQLGNMQFEDDHFTNQVNIASVNWYRSDGSHKRDQDWLNDNHHSFALHLIAKPADTDEECHLKEWVYCINASSLVQEFNLPIVLNDHAWQCLLDTAKLDVGQYADTQVSPLFSLPAHSMMLFARQ